MAMIIYIHNPEGYRATGKTTLGLALAHYFFLQNDQTFFFDEHDGTAAFDLSDQIQNTSLRIDFPKRRINANLVDLIKRYKHGVFVVTIAEKYDPERFPRPTFIYTTKNNTWQYEQELEMLGLPIT